MNDNTQLIPFSVGLVISDSIDNSWYIRVIPIEQQGFIHGKIEDGSNVDEVKGKDSQGNSWETSYTTTNALTAKWISKDANRRTPPTIHKNEKVQLYKYADSDDIFWEDYGQDSRDRTTERYVKAWSNKTKRDGKEVDHANSYYFEVDTKTGNITLKTNKSNGEKFAYTVQIQGKGGILTLEDDAGQVIYIDSNKKETGLENGEGCKIQLLGKDVNVVAVDNINFKAGKKIEGIAPMVSWNASTSYVVKTATWGLTASSMTGTSTGTFAIKSTTFTHNGVNVGDKHSHMEQGDGKPVGPPQ